MVNSKHSPEIKISLLIHIFLLSLAPTSFLEVVCIHKYKFAPFSPAAPPQPLSGMDVACPKKSKGFGTFNPMTETLTMLKPIYGLKDAPSRVAKEIALRS